MSEVFYYFLSPRSRKLREYEVKNVCSLVVEETLLNVISELSNSIGALNSSKYYRLTSVVPQVLT